LLKSFNELFKLMMERRASHFHLVPGSPIMIRQLGKLSALDTHVLSPTDTARMANAILTDKQKRIFEERLEVNFSYSIPGLSRYRISVFRQRGSIAMVISTSPPTPPSLEELGLPDIVRKTAIQAEQGLFIICGPKASGKSSTLAALTNHILESRNVQVISLENPIEYLLKNKTGVICQREKGTDFKSYEHAFNSIKHQSCDILMLTEFEELEVAKKIINLVSSGHMVIITAQAPSVVSMLDKIVDMFPPHQRQQILSLLSVGLNAVISQTLLNRATGNGYIPAFEILTGASQIKSLIKDDKFAQLQSFMAAHGRELGMQTQEQALRSLIKKNLISREEAMAKAVRPEEFKKMLSMGV
jgi:twitching motility protein PilT